MRVRRAAVASGVTLTLALSAVTTAGLGGAAQASDAGSSAGAERAATTGRLITATKKGVVLVDEDGRRERTLIRVRGQRADVLEMHPETGVFLWSTTTGKRTTFHISNVFGADLGDFRTPKGASEPAIDNGGYEVYWVRQGSATQNAAVVSYEINDPQAEPQVLTELGPGTARGLEVSPDYQWLSVVLAGPSSTSVQLVPTNGATVRTVPATAPGSGVIGDRAVFSPDSGRVAYLSGAAPGAVGSLFYAPVAGDYAPVDVRANASELFDWSPDAQTLLAAAPGSGTLVGYAVATGAAVATYPVSRLGDAGVFWSGLAAGEFPRDRIRPRLRVDQPKRDTVRAWSTVTGTAVDKGESGLRYVVFRAFQKRGNAWWGLVGNGKRPTWKKFPNRLEAKLFAKERRAKIEGKAWSLGIPGLRAGRLVLVVKAADGAGNSNAKTVSVQVR
ncbi:hypothetical protein [Nocardioides flavescens]|uniref:WD40-like Beta Propeller Repeat n=1 Tax=Nocardioides flavescens TaxID=2691959 RepID=A0A6L7F192_9ACTN|nr:hypothetical protein [Nocardioides flavescens]MXG90132.1 hypothetical protein [Nocardioides flavescens]